MTDQFQLLEVQVVNRNPVYELQLATASPLLLADAKVWMKVETATDDVLIQSLIDGCTEWAENYTGRDFSPKDWRLLLDCFETRIKLRRDPVNVDGTIIIQHLVSGIFVTITTLFYIRKDVQFSEILLVAGEEYPDNTDDREQAIRIDFQTEGYFQQDLIIKALNLIVAYIYENRGDCSIEDAAKLSGATLILDQIRIARF